jgi:hypothetical protein
MRLGCVRGLRQSTRGRAGPALRSLREMGREHPFDDMCDPVGVQAGIMPASPIRPLNVLRDLRFLVRRIAASYT